MNIPLVERIVDLDAQLSVILQAGGIDRGRALFDKYRTASDRDELVLVMITRLLLEHDRRKARG